MLWGMVLWGGWPRWHSVASGNPGGAFQVAWILRYLACPACFHCPQNAIFYSEKPDQRTECCDEYKYNQIRTAVMIVIVAFVFSVDSLPASLWGGKCYSSSMRRPRPKMVSRSHGWERPRRDLDSCKLSMLACCHKGQVHVIIGPLSLWSAWEMTCQP